MAFQPCTTDEKKGDTDYEDELNFCTQEAIVHEDEKGKPIDKRKPITESIHNQESIIKCVGQLETTYKYPEREYEPNSITYGTATVVFTTNDKCFALSAAHNIRTQIKECQLQGCEKYMENTPDITKCIHCNHDELKCKLISATTIEFRRREIKTNVYVNEQKETTHYKFGDKRGGYGCLCEYIDEDNYSTYPFPITGYDYCVLSFINDDNYPYSEYCKTIRIKNDMFALYNKNVHTFRIYGYPMSKTDLEEEKHHKMYGMGSTARNYSVELSTNSNQYYFKHREIDTTAGQSGAAIWYKQNNMTVIFAIHSGAWGEEKKKKKKKKIIQKYLMLLQL